MVRDHPSYPNIRHQAQCEGKQQRRVEGFVPNLCQMRITVYRDGSNYIALRRSPITRGNIDVSPYSPVLQDVRKTPLRGFLIPVSRVRITPGVPLIKQALRSIDLGAFLCHFWGFGVHMVSSAKSRLSPLHSDDEGQMCIPHHRGDRREQQRHSFPP